MHPLKKYLRSLKIAAADRSGFERSVDALAQTTGTSSDVLKRLHYHHQSNLSPIRALRLELATNGQVPATSVCTDADEIVSLVIRVIKLRENNSVAGVV